MCEKEVKIHILYPVCAVNEWFLQKDKRALVNARNSKVITLIHYFNPQYTIQAVFI